jgi:hypothetical protein
MIDQCLRFRSNLGKPRRLFRPERVFRRRNFFHANLLCGGKKPAPISKSAPFRPIQREHGVFSAQTVCPADLPTSALN